MREGNPASQTPAKVGATQPPEAQVLNHGHLPHGEYLRRAWSAANYFWSFRVRSTSSPP